VPLCFVWTHFDLSWERHCWNTLVILCLAFWIVARLASSTLHRTQNSPCLHQHLLLHHLCFTPSQSGGWDTSCGFESHLSDGWRAGSFYAHEFLFLFAIPSSLPTPKCFGFLLDCIRNLLQEIMLLCFSNSWYPLKHKSVLLFLFTVYFSLLPVLWCHIKETLTKSKVTNLFFFPLLFIYFFCGTGVWTQSLHLEPLHQPFCVMGFFEIGCHELFA
jgi:hypothetical protein